MRIDGVVRLLAPASLFAGGFITLNGQTGNDTFTIDYDNGTFTNFYTVVNGGSDSGLGDNLTVQGNIFASMIYSATEPGAGRLDFSGPTARVDFTGLEPVTVTSGLGAVTIDVDAAGAVAGLRTIDLTDTVGANLAVTFDPASALENITFTVPAASLTLLGDSDSDDVITINSVDATYAAATIIDGRGGNDSANLNAALNVSGGSGVIAVTSEAINLNANLSATGAISLTATETAGVNQIDMAAGVSISSSGGSLSLSAADDFTLAATNFLSAVGAISLNSVDTALDAAGAVFNMLGRATVTGAGSTITRNGSSQVDTFNLNPTGTGFTAVGNVTVNEDTLGATPAARLLATRARDAALGAILNELANTSTSIATRVNNIKTGGGLTLGNMIVPMVSVVDDSTIDTVSAEAGDDWVIAKQIGTTKDTLGTTLGSDVFDGL